VLLVLHARVRVCVEAMMRVNPDIRFCVSSLGASLAEAPLPSLAGAALAGKLEPLVLITITFASQPEGAYIDRYIEI